MWFFSCFNKLIAIVKLIVFFKIVDKIALTKFPLGRLHGGNPPQIVTDGGSFVMSTIQIVNVYPSLIEGQYKKYGAVQCIH